MRFTKNNRNYEILKCSDSSNQLKCMLLTEVTDEGKNIILLGGKTSDGALCWRTVEELDNSYSLAELNELTQWFIGWMDSVG